jgi:pimeloyl-ACP methyl ester carboxylesterase
LRVLRALLWRVPIALLGLLAVLCAAGALYEALAARQDDVRYPPPGRLIDVGGYRVHMLCMGEGRPTVLLNAWSGGWSAEWETVQPVLARDTRVCAWDRAGSGWSDLGTHSHSPVAYTQEMENVLRAASIDGPYVLVAASYAGRVTRLYAAAHPEQVLGVVLLDAVHEDSHSQEEIAEQRRQAPMYAAGNWILSRLGVARLLGADLVPFIDGPVGYALSERTRELVAVVSTRPKNLEGNARLAAQQQADDAALRATPSFGDKALVVLSASDTAASLTQWAQAQARLASLSTRSLRLIAQGPHLIAWSHPDVVVAAVQCASKLSAAPALSAGSPDAPSACRDLRAHPSVSEPTR